MVSWCVIGVEEKPCSLSEPKLVLELQSLNCRNTSCRKMQFSGIEPTAAKSHFYLTGFGSSGSSSSKTQRHSRSPIELHTPINKHACMHAWRAMTSRLGNTDLGQYCQVYWKWLTKISHRNFFLCPIWRCLGLSLLHAKQVLYQTS